MNTAARKCEALKRKQDCGSDETGVKLPKLEKTRGWKRLCANFGITAFVKMEHGISDTFAGVGFKQRYSDFIVNEIAADGQVARLTSFDLPVIKEEDNIDVSGLDENRRRDIEKAIDGLLSSEDKTDELSICADGADKYQRTLIHSYIKILSQGHGKNVESKTCGSMIIMKRCPRANKNKWPSKNNKFITCVMHKQNVDTQQALSYIANSLGIDQRKIAYSGLKDKRGKTTQFISLKHILPERLLKINEKCSHIKLGNFNYTKKPVELYKLNGNEFSVLLRDVAISERETLNNRFKSLQSDGFINYFGLQRFGNYSSPTDMIGSLILRREFEKAVRLILDPDSTKDVDLSMALQCYKDNGNALKASTFLHCRHGKMENRHAGRVLMNIADQEDQVDWKAAMEKIPASSRSLYIHAYQSKLWNIMASSRLEIFGLKVSPGDLYKAGDAINVVIDSNVNDIDIYDIVIPMVGTKVKLPEGESGRMLDDLLAKDGLTRESFSSNEWAYHVPGAYRNWIVKPAATGASLQFVDYQNRDMDDVIESDFDELLQQATRAQETTNGRDDDNDDNGKEASRVNLPGENAGDMCHGAVVRFSLPASSYATMALREFLGSNDFLSV